MMFIYYDGKNYLWFNRMVYYLKIKLFFFDLKKNWSIYFIGEFKGILKIFGIFFLWKFFIVLCFEMFFVFGKFVRIGWKWDFLIKLNKYRRENMFKLVYIVEMYLCNILKFNYILK